MVYLPHWPIPSTLGNRSIDYETVFERMSVVLARLGNPHQKLSNVIHIAGTNGKGSTASLIAKILRCAGYKTHLYTSPHLFDCNERINLNGEKISDNFLYEIFEEVRINSADVTLTFMESFTIGAFLAFAKTPADFVVLETGMGGRIDATNIIEKKMATVITPISFDHTEYLGNSIEKIAFEKTLIIRPETALIVAPQIEAAKNIIKILSKDQRSPSYFYDEDFSISIDSKTNQFNFFWQEELIYKNLPKPALEGNHQYFNFACAIATCEIIKEKLGEKFSISQDTISQAIKTVEWRSRLEKIDNNLLKLFKNPLSEIWIDGAHNEAGALILANWINSQNKNSKPHKESFVICGFSRKKCKAEFLEKFVNVAKIVAITVEGEPYPEKSETILQIAEENNIEIIAYEDLFEALVEISNKVKSEACRIIICGSLHLARDVKKFSQFL